MELLDFYTRASDNNSSPFRYVFEASDHDSKVSMVKPEILSKLTAMHAKASELPLVTNLKQTSDLLILVCNLDDIDEDLRQLGYECLAIVQAFRRIEGES